MPYDERGLREMQFHMPIRASTYLNLESFANNTTQKSSPQKFSLPCRLTCHERMRGQITTGSEARHFAPLRPVACGKCDSNLDAFPPSLLRRVRNRSNGHSPGPKQKQDRSLQPAETVRPIRFGMLHNQFGTCRERDLRTAVLMIHAHGSEIIAWPSDCNLARPSLRVAPRKCAENMEARDVL
ncbi:uncharacterized protein RCC_07721 [Ramularia collo-cygni]|uniref:Uncharacterized protein n=1 Tax=Ramularia collo-cygni TaxID=112498 RepID=A0A2D3VG10_9PEZI|nr:uncharacterized protein RCC_07721 [Ramularia collo-cygni]CZT21854.1 uncharacterized protein RCC_07721 [Ramularia collo-cygni]